MCHIGLSIHHDWIELTWMRVLGSEQPTFGAHANLPLELEDKTISHTHDK